MGSTLKFFIMFLSFAFGSAAFAAEDAAFFMCRNNKTVRTIQVKKRDGECATVYTKAGVDREMASGKSYQSCVNVMNNIKENIEKAGWKCKAATPAGSSGT